MAIRNGTSILGAGAAAGSIAIEADVIQTANVLGYCYRRMTLGQPLSFDCEGHENSSPDGPADGGGVGSASRKRRKALRAEHVELGLHMEMALLLFEKADVFGGSGSTTFGPFKNHFPAIVGGGGDYPRDDPRRLQVETENAARAYCLDKGSGAYPGGIGYQGQGAYIGVVKWNQGSIPHTHYSTTRWVLKTNVDYTSRFRPTSNAAFSGMAELGAAVEKRCYGMQGTNAAQIGIRDDDHMVFQHGVVPDADTDVIGYTHGLPMAVAAVEASWFKGVPMEVANPLLDHGGNLTKKMSSCFQCTVYMDACGYAASSVHLGRGESWIPPYPSHYTEDNQHLDGISASAMKASATACLGKYQKRCHTNLHDGYQILARTGGIVGTHQAAFELLRDKLEELNGEHSEVAADLILDASAVHEKDYMRVLRTLWADSNMTLAQKKTALETEAVQLYPGAVD
jgi:hypothetical protein